MQMKDLVSSCRGGGEGTLGPVTVTASWRQGPYISYNNGTGSTKGAGAAPEDGGTRRVGKHRFSQGRAQWGVWADA